MLPTFIFSLSRTPFLGSSVFFWFLLIFVYVCLHFLQFLPFLALGWEFLALGWVFHRVRNSELFYHHFYPAKFFEFVQETSDKWHMNFSFQLQKEYDKLLKELPQPGLEPTTSWFTAIDALPTELRRLG